MYRCFTFRVLRENRRVCKDETREEELEHFHQVLTDISWGEATQRVRDFFVQAYVRGAPIGCAERVEFDGTTAIFTKRRYRDRTNRIVVRRVAKKHNHTLKVKGKCRPKGARGQFYSDSKVQYLRKRARTQALFNLHLAGDFHAASETKDLPVRSHMMRVMLVSNLAVDQRFANGTQDNCSTCQRRRHYHRFYGLCCYHCKTDVFLLFLSLANRPRRSRRLHHLLRLSYTCALIRALSSQIILLLGTLAALGPGVS